MLLDHDVACQMLEEIHTEFVRSLRISVLDSEVRVERVSLGMSSIKSVHVVDESFHVSFSDLSNLLAVGGFLLFGSSGGCTGLEAFR